ncbi:putative electron transfer flavoprotein FixA [Pseudodesulfovibrio sp. JC047]|uniref:putative electron transfer flavoprotein FixA n=1 Tax=Pseudodesulfovibrio sp. JC047 TaxID=2683199 RepID=UPI0013D013A8|nr:putative electron transfer flavoprotein FixA [Pseudodesulfovibrio sp. JC047]NDV18393.1 putative electron transfer flavoprotein FixA [Pseudodesulfovibrio sp. JC047]
MKIIVGCKLVPEEQDITVQKDGTLDLSKATPKISQFDLNAIEAAVEIKAEIADSTITALSVGGKYLDNTKARKDILSRGPDELTSVIDENLETALPHQTARIMAAAAQKNGFDLIICGDGSGDLYAQQVGIRLGAELEVSTLNGVTKIVSVSNDLLVVERALETEVETLEVSLPAVISVSPDINVPTIPGMKSILKAGKKPVNAMTLSDLGLADDPALVELVEIKAAQKKDRKNIIIEGDGEDKIAEFVSHLRTIMN